MFVHLENYLRYTISIILSSNAYINETERIEWFNTSVRQTCAAAQIYARAVK